MSYESLRVEGAEVVATVLKENRSCGVEEHGPRCLESNAYDVIDALMAKGWRIHTGEK